MQSSSSDQTSQSKPLPPAYLAKCNLQIMSWKSCTQTWSVVLSFILPAHGQGSGLDRIYWYRRLDLYLPYDLLFISIRPFSNWPSNVWDEFELQSLLMKMLSGWMRSTPSSASRAGKLLRTTFRWPGRMRFTVERNGSCFDGVIKIRINITTKVYIKNVELIRIIVCPLILNVIPADV